MTATALIFTKYRKFSPKIARFQWDIEDPDSMVKALNCTFQGYHFWSAKGWICTNSPLSLDDVWKVNHILFGE